MFQHETRDKGAFGQTFTKAVIAGSVAAVIVGVIALIAAGIFLSGCGGGGGGNSGPSYNDQGECVNCENDAKNGGNNGTGECPILSCNDNIACTLDECVDGACENTPDDSLCSERERCDLDHGGCFKPKSCFNDEQCDDGVDCTIEGCDTETNLCLPPIKDNQRCKGMQACELEGCVISLPCQKDDDCVPKDCVIAGKCQSGFCKWTTNDDWCEDENPCIYDEHCTVTIDYPGIIVKCDYSVAITEPSCEEYW